MVQFLTVSAAPFVGTGFATRVKTANLVRRINVRILGIMTAKMARQAIWLAVKLAQILRIVLLQFPAVRRRFTIADLVPMGVAAQHLLVGRLLIRIVRNVPSPLAAGQ